ncbi:MAG: DUF3224 domain-containing protein [Terracidiphilus sp.]|jgi:hypothetical protein
MMVRDAGNQPDGLAQVIMRIFKSVVLCACLSLAAQLHPQASASKPHVKAPTMTRHAEGTFDVKMTPIPADGGTDTVISRYAGVKQFHGDLEAASNIEMLAAGDPAKGNAGYVAMEHVTGTLHGQAGSFALQHNGAMENGGYRLSVSVVPGTGTGALTGIAGTMTITIVSGKHSYTFDYTLPAPAQ